MDTFNSNTRKKYEDLDDYQTIKERNRHLETFTSHVMESGVSLKVEASEYSLLGIKLYTVDDIFMVYIQHQMSVIWSYGLCPVHLINDDYTEGVVIDTRFAVFDTIVEKIRKLHFTSDTGDEDVISPKPDKPCYVYLQELKHPDVIAVKYGIAGDPKERMRNQSGVSQFDHYLLYETLLPTRPKALALEKAITKEFGGYYCEKAWMPDGYTETLAHDKIQPVIEFIKDYLK